jgi:hypothetical protein
MKVSQHNFAFDNRLRKLNAMVQQVIEFSFHFMDEFGWIDDSSWANHLYTLIEDFKDRMQFIAGKQTQVA